MIPLIAVILGAVITAMPLAVADVRRHDQQVRERDDDLEEWLIARHRERIQRLNELAQQQRVAGVSGGGAPAQALGKVNTIVLYDYREAQRQAEAFRLRVDAAEGWQHRLVRLVRRRKLPRLTTPDRASALIE